MDTFKLLEEAEKFLRLAAESVDSAISREERGTPRRDDFVEIYNAIFEACESVESINRHPLLGL